MMRELRNFLRIFIRLGLLGACIVVLPACKDDQFLMLQDENRLLKQEVERQSQAMTELVSRVDDIDVRTSIPLPKFSVNDIKIDVVERMFEPIINGSFLMEVEGDALPPVVYLELEITTQVRGKDHAFTQNVIHRLMPGSPEENKIEFVHPLSLHKVKVADIELQVTPLTWYLGYRVKGENKS